MLKRTSKHARAASRLLEDQVGYNPRFRIQLDHNATATAIPTLEPQWIKNTLHCARSEIDAAPRRKVVLAVCPTPATDDRSAGTLVLDSARLSDIPVLVLAASGKKPHPKRYGRVSPNTSISSSSDELDADVLDFEDLMRKRLASRIHNQPNPRTDSNEIQSSSRRLWTSSDSENSSSRTRESVCDRRQENKQAKAKEEWPSLPQNTTVHRKHQAKQGNTWKIKIVVAC